MGRTITPTYRVEYRDQSGWHKQGYADRNGKCVLRKAPTDADAEEFRKAMNRSFNIGGSNYHVSEAAGKILHVSEVVIRKNDMDGRMVAHAKMPMFEVV